MKRHLLGAAAPAARRQGGFDVEAAICEDLLGGTFSAVDSPTRHNRAKSACVPGPTGAMS